MSEKNRDRERTEDEALNSTGWDAPSNTGSSGLAGTAEGIKNTPPSENSLPLPRPGESDE